MMRWLSSRTLRCSVCASTTFVPGLERSSASTLRLFADFVDVDWLHTKQAGHRIVQIGENCRNVC